MGSHRKGASKQDALGCSLQAATVGPSILAYGVTHLYEHVQNAERILQFGVIWNPPEG